MSARVPARRLLHSCPRLAQAAPTLLQERPIDTAPPPSTTTTAAAAAPSKVTTQTQTEHRRELSNDELVRRRDGYSGYLASIGSTVAPYYRARTLLHDPPAVRDVGVAALLAAEVHMGHSKSLWNPLTQPFVHGVRSGLHIFDLDVTLAHLRRAAEVVEGVAQNDGNILFVGTRDGQKRSVVEAARKAGGYHVFDRWVPGTITNSRQVVGHGRVKRMSVRHRLNSAAIADDAVSAPEAVVPDLVVVLNPLENRILIKECAAARVPTVGIIDSDADPRWVTYAIPGNDDSPRATTLLVGVLARAAQEGRRLLLSGGGQEGEWVQEEVVQRGHR